MTSPWVAAFLALTTLVLTLSLIVLGTLRRLVPLLESSQDVLSQTARRMTIGGLVPGSAVPPFLAVQADGAAFTERDLGGRTTALLFLDTGCEACHELVFDLANGQAPDIGVPLVVVSNDREQALALTHSTEVLVLIDEDRSFAAAFDTRVTPQAFVLRDARVHATGTPNSWDGLRELLNASGARGGGSQSEPAAAAMSS